MHSHNSFSINLNQQKAIAKKRLKAIRNGDLSVLTSVQRSHSTPEKLAFDTVKLADIQHALAREIGLPSWSKLKAHIEEQEKHRQAIADKPDSLDADLKTLHVRCGHDIQQQLLEGGFTGDFLPMIDPLCIGPTPNDEQRFVKMRAQYVVDTLLPIMGRNDTAHDVAQQEQKRIYTLLDQQFERIVLWVEHDSYDQLMVLRALTLLKGVQNQVIEIIELDQYPGTERFIGFGQLPAEAIRSCWQYRRPVTPKIISQATRCWQALVSATPMSMIALLQQHDLDGLPNMKDALTRHLQELPHATTGLSCTQNLVLTILKEQNQAIPVTKWFQLYQQREPLPFLGDVMFYALLAPMAMTDKPLIIIDDIDKDWWEQTVTISSYGQQCLEGRVKIRQHYWVGGIHNNEQHWWEWDHSHLSSLTDVSL
ncbi:DUF1835 domain-containing protein [Vibrio mytili]|uniref:DUF1835 domain-containing protein n=1 Tax=Vibrio mytili TaxID=50718 RepID=UPI003C701F95